MFTGASVNFLRSSWSNATEPLEQFSKGLVTTLRSLWRKFTARRENAQRYGADGLAVLFVPVVGRLSMKNTRVFGGKRLLAAKRASIGKDIVRLFT